MKVTSAGIEPRRNTHFYPESIIRIEGCSSYSKIICTEGPPFLISRVLGWFEEILSEKDFLRIHKSHVVNLGFVLQRETGGWLRLKNGEVVPVSRTYKGEFNKRVRPIAFIGSTDSLVFSAEPPIVCQQNYWLGTQDDRWGNAQNWSCGAVPGSSTVVVIQGEKPFSPVIRSEAICRKLNMQKDAGPVVSPG